MSWDALPPAPPFCQSGQVLQPAPSSERDLAVTQERDVLIDAARAASLLLVVIFHAGLWRVTLNDGNWSAQTMELGPWGWYGSWFVMCMPLFFVCGGYVHAIIVDRMHSRNTGLAHYLTNRGRRLVGPTTVFITIFAVPATIAAWAGYRDQAVFVGHNLTKLLWFLVAYLFTVAMAPFFVKRHDERPWLIPIVLTVVATTIDVVTIRTGVLNLRYANLFFVWLGCHQLGIAHQRGFLRRGPLWQPFAAIAVGVLAIVALLQAGWPVPAFGMGSRQLSNLQPPTVAMFWLALAQTGVMGLLTRREWRALEQPRTQKVLGAINALAMAIYLWHMPVVVVTFGIHIGLGMLFPSLVPVLTFPLVTLLVAIPLLAALVPTVARLDLRMVPPLGPRQNGPLAAAAMVVLTGSLAMVWRHGLVIHPKVPFSSLGVLGTWTGSALLARASNWRPQPSRQLGALR